MGVVRYPTTETTKVCSQRGVLLPLLWSILIDPLLSELQNLLKHAKTYTDNVAALVVGRDIGMMGRNIQRAIYLIASWCFRPALSVKPHKTTMVLFTGETEWFLLSIDMGYNP